MAFLFKLIGAAGLILIAAGYDLVKVDKESLPKRTKK